MASRAYDVVLRDVRHRVAHRRLSSVRSRVQGAFQFVLQGCRRPASASRARAAVPPVTRCGARLPRARGRGDARMPRARAIGCSARVADRARFQSRGAASGIDPDRHPSPAVAQSGSTRVRPGVAVRAASADGSAAGCAIAPGSRTSATPATVSHSTTKRPVITSGSSRSSSRQGRSRTPSTPHSSTTAAIGAPSCGYRSASTR